MDTLCLAVHILPCLIQNLRAAKQRDLELIQGASCRPALEYIVRNVVDEELLEPWLLSGVADEDIKYGDLIVTEEDIASLGYYAEDDDFAYLMGLFLRQMARAQKHGGLCCGGIDSKEL